MEEIPSDLRAFLLNHPFLQLTEDKKVSEQLASQHNTKCGFPSDASRIASRIASRALDVLIKAGGETTTKGSKSVNDRRRYRCTELKTRGLIRYTATDTCRLLSQIRCSLNGHEFPCNLAELQRFTQGKKYEKLSAAAEFNYGQYEPHIVPSTKQP